MLFRIGNRRVLRYTRPMLSEDPARVVSKGKRPSEAPGFSRGEQSLCKWTRGHFGADRGHCAGRRGERVMSEFLLGVLCTLWLIVTVIILVVVWQLPEVPDDD